MTMGNRPCGRNAIFKCVAIIATVVTTFSCVACGNAADSGSTADKSAAQSQGKHEKVKKSATQGLDGAHLRDNDSLYKVYDDSGVETMYLTVSRGNKSEGTDHSWSEINQYSVDDYAAMRTNRYQVNGLLQVGTNRGLYPANSATVKKRRTPPCRCAASRPVSISRRTTKSS